MKLAIVCLLATASCYAIERTKEERLAYLLPAPGSTIHWHLEGTVPTGTTKTVEWFETRQADTVVGGVGWTVLRDSIAFDTDGPSLSYRRWAQDTLHVYYDPEYGAILGWDYVPGEDKDTIAAATTHSVKYTTGCSTVAGTFQDCLTIDVSDSAATRSTVYAKGIGPVYMKHDSKTKTLSLSLVGNSSTNVDRNMPRLVRPWIGKRFDVSGRNHPVQPANPSRALAKFEGGTPGLVVHP